MRLVRVVAFARRLCPKSSFYLRTVFNFKLPAMKLNMARSDYHAEMQSATFWEAWLTGKFQTIGWYTDASQIRTSVVAILEDFFLVQHGRGEEYSLEMDTIERRIVEKLGATEQERLGALHTFLASVPADAYPCVRLYLLNLAHHRE